MYTNIITKELLEQNVIQHIYQRFSSSKNFYFFIKKYLLVFALFYITLSNASCPATTPWSTPILINSSGNISSNIFSAATTNGFMAVWADSSNNAFYSFSTDAMSWRTGSITAAQGTVATNSDVFVAGNDTGFVATWIDNANNAWSSFSSDNGITWGSAIAINPISVTLNSHSDVYVAASSAGFVATMIGSDNNAYISFSTGISPWSTPVQFTSDGTVYDQNWNSKTTRGFISAVVTGSSCMLTWITTPLSTNSAYFSSINPFSLTTVYPVVSIGFFESVPVVTALDEYYMAVSRANQGAGQTYFSVATKASSWATFSPFAVNPDNHDAGPWIAANQNGFMSVWTNDGNPIWTLSTNNGFNWTPVCSILSAPSTTIFAPVGLSANAQGFIATWLDTNDANVYVSFYATPIPPVIFGSDFVSLLQQKYGPLL